MKFADKVVMITGAASGIGLEAAKTFAKEGAKLILTDIQEEAGKAVANDLQNAGAAVTFIAGNVTNYGHIKEAVATAVSEFGCLDIALNNAGIGSPLAPTEHTRLEDWDRVIEVNQTAVFYCMKEQLKVMAQQKSGCIVNVSSIAGMRGLPNQIAYTASKHAVIGMTKAAAGEYARLGIRVNAVCPVFTHTPLVDKLFSSQEGLDQKLLRTIPLRRFGEVSDIVNAICWLCDPASSYITGLALPVDGGQTI